MPRTAYRHSGFKDLVLATKKLWEHQPELRLTLRIYSYSITNYTHHRVRAFYVLETPFLTRRQRLRVDTATAIGIGRVASATTNVCLNPARTLVSCGAGPGTCRVQDTVRHTTQALLILASSTASRKHEQCCENPDRRLTPLNNT